MNYQFGSKKFKKRYLILLLCSITTNYVLAAQQPLNAVPKSTASNAITVVRDGINTELAKQHTMNTELYSLYVSGLPPCSNAGDIREWDGDSWECTPVIDFSATSPLSVNSTTGVLSLTPWESQSALETWLGWTFSGSGGGITVSSSLPTTAGSAALNDSTHVLTVASDTGYTQFTGTFTAWDTTPLAFTFTDETDIDISTAKTSNAITVEGINHAAAISVTGDTGFGYSKNSAACTATTGTVVLGDTVAACVTSSGGNSAATTATVDIGGVTDQYSVTTVAATQVYMGINFRSTAGYVTDAAGETYCQGYNDAYPVSRGGYTFGWETNVANVDSRDRQSGNDRRLSGQNVTSNLGPGLQTEFRLDLPSTGTYTIRLALGDGSYSQDYQYAQLLDGSTVFATIDDSNGTAANEFTDATGTNRTAAEWPGSNASISRTFTSTILRVRLGTPTAQSGATTIAHISVSK